MKRILGAMALIAASVAVTSTPSAADPAPRVPELPDVAAERMPDVAYERTLAPGESFRIELEDGTVVEAGVGQAEPIDGTGDFTALSHPATCTSFWQATTYAAYKVKNEGKFCHNGHNVWLKNSSYPNYEGFHRCLTEWAVGYDVTHKCTHDKGTASGGAVFMNFWDHYDACFVTKYAPLCASNWMRARGFEGGHVNYAWD